MANVQAADRTRFDFDPVRGTWRLLTSVRFALALIGFLAFAALLGILIPQIPSQMRDNQVAINSWLEFEKQDKFGFFTDPMYRLGLFDVFRSLWFVVGLFILVASVCVCTANRLPPIWRNVRKPQTRVPDEYFDRPEGSIAVAAPDVDALAEGLRRRRYKVQTMVEGSTTYLFADRFSWAQFATFVSHLALILFLAGGFVTLIASREEQIFVGEGEPGVPVFAPTDRDYMQVHVEQAIGKFDATGFPLDFRTYIDVYKGGSKVAEGWTTVNDPLIYDGYRFHQSAYFPDGAALQVRDLKTGRVVYDEVLPLTSQAPTPHIVVRDATGKTVVDDVIVPTDFISDAAGTLVTIPGSGRTFWIGARSDASNQNWQLVVFETTADQSTNQGVQDVLQPYQHGDLGGYDLSFLGMTSVPSKDVSDLPGTSGDVVAEMSQAASGPELTVGPIGGSALALAPNQPVQAGGYEYTFEGQRAFAGLTVRRDPGSTFIWLATGALLLGLALTFYTPRRRLWGKIQAGQASFRGLGGRAKAIEGEIKQVAQKAAPSGPDQE